MLKVLWEEIAMLSQQRFTGVLGSIVLCGTALLPPFACAEEPAKPIDWTMAEEIVARIEEPRIPDRDFIVTDFGAVADDDQDDRVAILAAIDAAVAEGGGRVVLPVGTWVSDGPVVLQSKINLHVAQGATLLFGPDPADYLPAVKTRWEGTEMMGYSPLIYGRDVEDVAVTGTGTLDGNGASGFDAWAVGDIQKPDQLALRQMGIDGVPAEDRQMGEGHFLRPSMLQIFGGERVLLENYRIINSPFWVNHIVYTDHAIVRGLRVESRKRNNDGIDVDSSSHVLIEDNTFTTGDDSIVVKSGRDADGRAIARPSEYVVVRNNELGGEDGIALGSEMSGDVRYVFFDNNTLRDGVSAIRFKGNLDRGGVVEHIRVRNMQIGNFENLIWFELNYPGEMGGNYAPIYRDLVFEDLDVQNVKNFFQAHATAGDPLTGVVLRDINVKSVEVPLVLENVQDLTFERVTLGDQVIDGKIDWTNPIRSN